jgi:hypothetical protein
MPSLLHSAYRLPVLALGPSNNPLKLPSARQLFITFPSSPVILHYTPLQSSVLAQLSIFTPVVPPSSPPQHHPLHFPCQSALTFTIDNPSILRLCFQRILSTKSKSLSTISIPKRPFTPRCARAQPSYPSSMQRRCEYGRTKVDGSTRPRVSILLIFVITPLLETDLLALFLSQPR